MPETDKQPIEEPLEVNEPFEEQQIDVEVTVDASLEKAIETFRKVREQQKKDPITGESVGLTDQELAVLDKECDVIKSREIIMSDVEHEIKEIVGDGKVLMGPPNLTRFEKARIMGARALQLSLGAPTFIDIPETATTSLDIAMEELDQRLIPISIRRVLPNGDFQNIPLFEFSNES